MGYNYELKDGETEWTVFYPDDWRDREKAVYSNPQGVDISALPAVEYKYFDRFREISVEHQSGQISKEEFQEKLRLIRKDYEADLNVFTDAMAERYGHQQRIKKSEVLLSRLSKGEYADISDAFAIAVQCISEMREESTTQKAIMAKAKEKGVISSRES